ncbi:MAG: LemA family protein, partial [Kiritimatiellaceae bacterium]|nr:LemA family protein [Kiritimatiellaceae bacterium]
MFVALIILVILILIAIGIYNSLIGKKNTVENAFGSIDVMCKKRYDLIPNLVATVKQYAAHESGTLEKVTALRNQAS